MLSHQLRRARCVVLKRTFDVQEARQSSCDFHRLHELLDSIKCFSLFFRECELCFAVNKNESSQRIQCSKTNFCLIMLRLQLSSGAVFHFINFHSLPSSPRWMQSWNKWFDFIFRESLGRNILFDFHKVYCSLFQGKSLMRLLMRVKSTNVKFPKAVIKFMEKLLYEEWFFLAKFTKKNENENFPKMTSSDLLRKMIARKNVFFENFSLKI